MVSSETSSYMVISLYGSSETSSVKTTTVRKLVRLICCKEMLKICSIQPLLLMVVS